MNPGMFRLFSFRGRKSADGVCCMDAPLPEVREVEPFSFPEGCQRVRLACVGDSITEGHGADPGRSYPEQLGELLGERWVVGNFGAGGRTVMRKGDRPYWGEEVYLAALGFAPDVVIVKLGTNDAKRWNWRHRGGFCDDYRALVESFLRLESGPRVWVCRPCPVHGRGNFGISEGRVREVIGRIDRLAEEMELGVIDMHGALAGRPEVFPDRVHPNTAGAGVMARVAYRALTGSDPEV